MSKINRNIAGAVSLWLLAAAILLNLVGTLLVTDESVELYVKVGAIGEYFIAAIFAIISGMKWMRGVGRIFSIILLIIISGFPAIGFLVVISTLRSYPVPNLILFTQAIFLISLALCWTVVVIDQWFDK